MIHSAPCKAIAALTLVFASIFSPAATGDQAEETVIHAARLIDVSTGEVLGKQSILIRGDSISSIEPGYLEHPNTIDLTDSTVMPGWID